MSKLETMPDCHVIIVNWNGGELAARSAVSAARQSIQPTVWVVDNDSSDGSRELIQESCPGLRLIRNRSNSGYAAANNQALRLSGEAQYVLLLNNDAVLPDNNSLANAITYLADRPGVHGVCGRYEYPDGRFQRFYNRLPTPANLIATFGIGRYFPFLRNSRATRRFLMLDADFDFPMRVEQPAFACVLMRGECARAVGFLDEEFPIFFNDVDYCWRWRAAGFCWEYLPDWRIVHELGSSTRKLKGMLAAEMSGSAVRFAIKHFPIWGRLAVRAAVFLEAVWSRIRGRLTISPVSIYQGRHFFRASYPVIPEAPPKQVQLG
jgi:GT2 family glycosyltransferase